MGQPYGQGAESDGLNGDHSLFATSIPAVHPPEVVLVLPSSSCAVGEIAFCRADCALCCLASFVLVCFVCRCILDWDAWTVEIETGSLLLESRVLLVVVVEGIVLACVVFEPSGID